MTPRRSDGQILIWESDHLTVSPGRVKLPIQAGGHKVGKCPSGHPVCSECVRVRSEGV